MPQAVTIGVPGHKHLFSKKQVYYSYFRYFIYAYFSSWSPIFLGFGFFF